jgi:hypothetical protein
MDDTPSPDPHTATRRAVLGTLGAHGATATVGHSVLASDRAAAGTAAPTESWKAAVANPDALDGMRATASFLTEERSDTVVGRERATGEPAWRYTPAGNFTTSYHDSGLYVQSGATVTALAANGTERWTYSHGESGNPRVVLGDDRGFFGTDTELAAVATADGSDAWTATEGATVPLWATSDVLLVQQSKRDAPDVFAGRDPATGDVLWTYELEQNYTRKTFTYDDAGLYFFLEGTLTAVGLADGATWFEYDYGSAFLPSAATYEETVFVTTSQSVTTIDPDTGDVVGTADLGTQVLPVDAGGGNVYCIGETTLYAVDTSGTVVFETDVTTDGGFTFRSPVSVHDGTVYLARSGELVALTPEGTQTWSTTLPEGQANSVGTDGDGLFAVDGSTLYGFALDGDGIASAGATEGTDDGGRGDGDSGGGDSEAGTATTARTTTTTRAGTTGAGTAESGTATTTTTDGASTAGEDGDGNDDGGDAETTVPTDQGGSGGSPGFGLLTALAGGTLALARRLRADDEA